MAIEYKYLPLGISETPPKDLIGEHNNPSIPGGIIDKLVVEFERVNPIITDSTTTIFIPILPPFFKKHDTLVSEANIGEMSIEKPVLKEIDPDDEEVAEIVEPTPEIVPEVIPRTSRPPQAAKPKPPTSPPKKIEKKGTMGFKPFPYTFSRPGETIEAVVRLFNDMSVSKHVIQKLVYEFSVLNPDACPPKLGQTVQVPVLLPFTYRHMNENKIFTDE